MNGSGRDSERRLSHSLGPPARGMTHSQAPAASQDPPSAVSPLEATLAQRRQQGMRWGPGPLGSPRSPATSNQERPKPVWGRLSRFAAVLLGRSP